MVPLLRKSLVCFYCGSRSKQKQDGTVRQWLCQSCDAVNYLDENGEITDFVPPSPAEKVRYADPRPASVKPKPLSFSSLNDNEQPFCSTCLKNQHLLTQALAAYLPPPTDPRYLTYEASYPEYRRKLEQRYPQVCPACEDGVAKQIRQAEYMANTEYLRRKIEATRNGARRTLGKGWGWRRMLIFTGGVTWLTSLLLQGLWHVLSARAQRKIDDGLIGDLSDMTPGRFLRNCVMLKDDADCLPTTALLVRMSLVMAVGSVWWNNQLWRKTMGTWARLAGLDDYYKLQLVVLLVRTAAWWTLQRNTFKGLDREALKACHLFMLAFITLSTIISLRVVKINPEPRVSFRRTAEDLASRRGKPRVVNAAPAPALAPAPAPIYLTPPNSQTTHLTPLASPPRFIRPPSPPVSDVDEMDWTPSQEQEPSDPNPSQASITNLPQQAPSPFYGCLPAQPISPAARLRNPPNRPHLRKIPDSQKEALVNNMRGYSSSDDNEDADSNGKGKNKKHSITLADPRFFPDDKYNRDTGLESLFDSILTVGDEPSEVTEAIKSQERARVATTNASTANSSIGIKLEKAWREWVVPALLVVPVIIGLQWVVWSIWGIWGRVVGSAEVVVEL